MTYATEVETYTLEVDIASGGYKYRNETVLGATPVETPTLLSEAQALAFGDAFFTGEGVDLPGAAYHTGETLYAVEEQVEEEQVEIPEAGILQEQILSRMPLHVSLSYGRVISPVVGVRTALGKLAPTQMALSVVGPGARTKMYLGDGGDVLGAQGGSRDIQPTGAEVTIMDADKAWDLYLADPTIAVVHIPWKWDVISRTAETLSYYEHLHGEGQSELIPVWVFTGDFYAEEELLAEDVLVYVPAAADYLPPEVEIEAPTAGAEFEAGELVTFRGSVVQQGKAPFTYEWFSSHDGFLGSGSTITVPLTPAIAKGNLVSHTISLQVTDVNGQQDTDSIMVVVNAAVYLPVTFRDW
jgi:hypothetical protein